MKKLLAVTSLIAIGAVAASAVHAETISQDLQVRAVVPAGDFYVNPASGWPTTPVQMGWDSVNERFTDYNLPLRMKNSLQTSGANPVAQGKIKASLGYPTVLTNGTDNMPVAVKVSSESKATPVVLTTTPQEVYANPAGAEENGNLNLSVNNVGTPVPGTYNGVAALIFDSAL
ncbi:hypothetical protein AWB67_04457 [Caballeronia terrestris]|uniref:CS1 type fimbrial major subunit n=1 Tax=Caballeronia terrestris TaxID=1226301 RepID=A0A158JXF6_9BURK|nr:hypothetical protein [Caballeronia terrestris]SAL73526.1 hypothetical protein AWB67_04457 [Caballeronia terrestris]